MKKRLLILGGGISGLSLAWQLSRYPEQFEIFLFESSPEAGGWMNSHFRDAFFFEQGPRTFRTQHSQALLTLILELGLGDQLLAANESAKRRYLWSNGRLCAVPWPFFKLSILKSLIKELWITPKFEEETVGDFARRRFGEALAESLFDPLTLGIYGGDLNQLSMQSCFPFVKRLEEEHGSVLKGLLLRKKELSPSLPIASPLFSLQGGCRQLVEALTSKLGPSLYLQERVESMQFVSEGVELFTSRGNYKGDYVLSALPPQENGRLFFPHDKDISALFNSIPLKSLYLVYMGYRLNCLKWQGFGYLIPSQEKEQAMGAIFDSMIFPQHNRHPDETRLTYIIRDQGQSSEKTVETALDAAKRHLQIEQNPSCLQVLRTQEVLPQFVMGHEKRMQALQTALERRFPQFQIVGNYLGKNSISGCVEQSFTLGKRIILT